MNKCENKYKKHKKYFFKFYDFLNLNLSMTDYIISMKRGIKIAQRIID